MNKFSKAKIFTSCSFREYPCDQRKPPLREFSGRKQSFSLVMIEWKCFNSFGSTSLRLRLQLDSQKPTSSRCCNRWVHSNVTVLQLSSASH